MLGFTYTACLLTREFVCVMRVTRPYPCRSFGAIKICGLIVGRQPPFSGEKIRGLHNLQKKPESPVLSVIDSITTFTGKTAYMLYLHH
jgi:hypothetical protein